MVLAPLANPSVPSGPPGVHSALVLPPAVRRTWISVPVPRDVGAHLEVGSHVIARKMKMRDIPAIRERERRQGVGAVLGEAKCRRAVR